MYSLRQATAADYDFLYDLHVSAMREHITATYGWDEAFVQNHFRDHFDLTRSQIVVVNGREAGVVAVERRSSEVYLANIEVMPAYQGRGLGTAIIRDILAGAQAAGLPVALQVLKVNPARRLYDRLGFTITGETPTHFLMRTVPDARPESG
jgi:ribosomal protein S18 acetylase RimI-like enzyme